MGWIFVGLFVVFFLISFVWGILRGVAKTRIRVAAVALSFVLALLLTAFLKTVLVSPWSMENIIAPALSTLEITLLQDLLGMSNTLNEVLMGCIGAIAAPLLFVVAFIICSLITWIIYTIVTLCFGAPLRHHNSRLHLKLVRLIPYAAVSALVLVMVLMVPVSVYADIAPTVTDKLTDAGILEGEAADTTNQILNDYVKPLNESVSVKTFRTLGGNAICESMTNFKVRDKVTNLKDEVGAVTAFGCNIFRLSKTEIAQYSSEEAAIILAVADSFDDSELLPAIVGEVVYNAAESWLQGEMFLTVEKPDLGELFDPFFNTILRVLQKDAQNTTALQADIRTLAELISTMAKHQVFGHLEDPNALMSALTAGGAVDEIIACLNKNDSMKVLIPEITNLGIRAMAGTLGIPANDIAIYEGMLGDIADSLNEIRALPTDSERTQAMTAELKTAFDNAGIVADDNLLACYSASMVNDMVDGVDAQIGAQDVRAFFALYDLNAGNAVVSSGSKEENLAGVVEVDPDVLKGTIYEGMSSAQLAKTGAAALANVVSSLSKITEDTADATIAEQASAIIVEAYSDLLGEDNAAMQQLSSIVIEAPLSQDTLDFVSGLSSAESVGEISSRITVEKLVVDAQKLVDSVGGGIDVEKEVKVIRAVMDAATEILGSDNPEDMDLNSIASAAGKVMDALSESSFFGEEQTATLFNAVLQSEQVRDVAGLDMATANQLAEKATQVPEGEKVNYTATMNSVSSSITIVTQMGKGEEIKEEDLVDMIRNLTPSSAGMIEVYVTPERLVGYGVPEAYSKHSATMIADVFGYLGRTPMSEEQFSTEAKALNQILNISMATKDTTGKKLFGEILPEAEELITILMSSEAIKYSLDKNMTDGEKVTVVDPYGLSTKLTNQEAETEEFLNALNAYHAHHPETKTLTLEALAAMLGFQVDLQ